MGVKVNEKKGLASSVQAFVFDGDERFKYLLGDKVALLKKSLRERNIKVVEFQEQPKKRSLWLAKGNGKSIIFQNTIPINSTLIDRPVTNNKTKAKKVLVDNGIRVPEGVVLNPKEFSEAKAWFDSLETKKAVIKPVDGSGGKGVETAIATLGDLRKALDSSLATSVVLEEHVEGRDYRVLVVGEEVVAAMCRLPAHVVGNGKNSLKELVDKKNKLKSLNPYDSKYPIKLGKSTSNILAEQGVSIDSLIEKGRVVYLKKVANIGAGGDGEDVTNSIHQDFIDLSMKSKRCFENTECCGVDIIAEDISRPANGQSYAVIEINVNCDIPIHHWPTLGQSRDVARYIAEYYFPNEPAVQPVSFEVKVDGRVYGAGYEEWLLNIGVAYGVDVKFKERTEGPLSVLLTGSPNAVDEVVSLCGLGPSSVWVNSLSVNKLSFDQKAGNELLVVGGVMPIRKNLMKPEAFSWDESQEFYKLLGDKKKLFRRVLMQKNVEVEVFPEDGVSPHVWRWAAKGKNKIVVFRGLMPLSTTYKKRWGIGNKVAAKKTLFDHGVRVPMGIEIEGKDTTQAISWFNSLDYKKVVVKPIGGSGGKGVVPGIVDSKSLEKSILDSSSKKIIIEQHVEGFDHRVLVVGGKVVAVMRRHPASIIGDGKSTAKELIDKKNALRADNPFERMYPIDINSVVTANLSKMGLCESSVIKAGDKVVLQSVANIGAGGEGENLTDVIHQGFIDEAINCGEAFGGLEYYGVDLMAEDISKDPSSQSYSVIEVNLNPGICMHHWPARGEALNVAKTIADYYFPDDKENHVSIKANIAGKVQDVGFRMWLCRQAVIYGLSGFCSNLDDGSLDIHLEGSKYSVDSVLKLCARGPKKAEVESVFF